MKTRLTLLFSLFLIPSLALAAAETPAAPRGMTLWETIQAGGLVMIVLGLLSLVMFSLVIFLVLRMSEKRVAPAVFLQKVVPHLEEKNYPQARRDCAGQDHAAAALVLAGLEQVSHGPKDAQDAVEKAARRETASLWTTLGYLADIAQVAPMLGLLGTVLGMIQAFNTIAFDTGTVKPLALAGGVAKAMITTAGGLIIAITATAFFSAVKTRVQYTIHVLESAAERILEAFRD